MCKQFRLQGVWHVIVCSPAVPQENRMSKTTSKNMSNILLRRPSRFGLRSGEEVIGWATVCLGLGGGNQVTLMVSAQINPNYTIVCNFSLALAKSLKVDNFTSLETPVVLFWIGPDEHLEVGEASCSHWCRGWLIQCLLHPCTMDGLVVFNTTDVWMCSIILNAPLVFFKAEKPCETLDLPCDSALELILDLSCGASTSRDYHTQRQIQQASMLSMFWLDNWHFADECRWPSSPTLSLKCLHSVTKTFEY